MAGRAALSQIDQRRCARWVGMLLSAGLDEPAPVLLAHRKVHRTPCPLFWRIENMVAMKVVSNLLSKLRGAFDINLRAHILIKRHWWQ